jgi:hypothetical protein
MRGPWLVVAVCGITSVVATWMLGDGFALEAQIRHDRGQNVAPVYEGWYRTADGSIRLSFGYLNRNFAEEVDIPTGADNRFEPGPIDRGQPTHFLPRSHHGVFTVTLPNPTADAEIKWTLTSRGRTVSVPANLSPLYEIDALKESGTEVGVSEPNTPPVLRFDPAGATGVGPAGTSMVFRTSPAQALALDVWVTDDGLPRTKESAGAGRSSLSVTWSKYRGTGTVKFSDPEPPVESGKAHTSATFDEPGEYILRVLASDGSRFADQCCWTNGYARVIVQSAGQGR